MEAWRRWQDWVTLAVGVLLIIAAFVFADAGTQAMTTVLVLAIILAVASLIALARPALMADRWVVIGVGVLLVAAPWVMGYADQTALAWSSWIGGVITAVMEAVELPEIRRHAGGPEQQA